MEIEYFLLKQWFEGVDGFALIFSIDSHITFDTITHYYKDVIKYIKDDRIPMILVGNKCFHKYFDFLKKLKHKIQQIEKILEKFQFKNLNFFLINTVFL